MRITQNMVTRNYIKRMNNNYGNLTKSNDKIASQRSFNKGYENVSDAGKTLRVRRLLADNERYQTTVRDVQGRVTAAEDSMRTLTDRLTMVKDRVVEANNGTLTDKDRDLIAQELSALQEETMALMNTSFSDKYVFAAAGNSGGQPPFSTDATGALLYQGQKVDDMYLDAGTGKVSLGGNEIKYNARNYVDIGFGYKLGPDGKVDPNTAFQDTFSGVECFGYGKDPSTGVPLNAYSLLSDMVTSLKANDLDRLGEDLNAITDSMTFMLRSITEVGARGVTLQNTQGNLENEYVVLIDTQNKLEGLDISEEIIYNKEYELSWNVTLQLGSKTLPTSIFDFLR